MARAKRAIFAQPDRRRAADRAKEVVRALEPRWPKAAELLRQSEDDLLAYMAFPKAQLTCISSTHPSERVNLEIRRRTDVVGVFPNDASVLRLVGTILRAIDDEWRAERRYFSQQSMKQLHDPEPSLFDVPAPFTLAPIR